MFISSTRALVDVGTLCPSGQQSSWNTWHVLGAALTPAISSVSDTIWSRSGHSRGGKMAAKWRQNGGKMASKCSD